MYKQLKMAVALIPVALEAADKMTATADRRNVLRQGHNLGFGFFKTLLLMPVIIVGIIILFGSLIAVGNGAYTMGTFIAFLIGAAMVAGPIWLIRSAGSVELEQPDARPSDPRSYQQQWQPQQNQWAPQQNQWAPPQNQWAPPQNQQYGQSPAYQQLAGSAHYATPFINSPSPQNRQTSPQLGARYVAQRH